MCSLIRNHELRHLIFEGVDTSPPKSRAHPVSGVPVSRHTLRGDTATAHPFLRWVLETAGTDPDMYRAGPLERRLPACLRALRCHSPEEAREQIERDPPRLQVALEAILLGVTGFFRDPAVFEELSLRLRAMAGRHTRGSHGMQDRPLRILSLSCSEGCELYSVAIVLAEAGLLEQTELLGTDFRQMAITRARSGKYSALSIQNSISPERREKYFETNPAGVRLKEFVRAGVRFEQHDLTRGVPPGPWHMILWRNTAIYLRPNPAGHLWRELARSLALGGLLVTGRAERPYGVPAMTRFGPSIYRKDS